MTPEVLAARLDVLEKQLVQQERIRDVAEVAVRQLQGACAIIRELLALEQTPAPTPSEGAPTDRKEGDWRTPDFKAARTSS